MSEILQKERTLHKPRANTATERFKASKGRITKKDLLALMILKGRQNIKNKFIEFLQSKFVFII